MKVINNVLKLIRLGPGTKLKHKQRCKSLHRCQYLGSLSKEVTNKETTINIGGKEL